MLREHVYRSLGLLGGIGIVVPQILYPLSDLVGLVDLLLVSRHGTTIANSILAPLAEGDRTSATTTECPFEMRAHAATKHGVTEPELAALRAVDGPCSANTGRAESAAATPGSKSGSRWVTGLVDRCVSR